MNNTIQKKLTPIFVAVTLTFILLFYSCNNTEKPFQYSQEISNLVTGFENIGMDSNQLYLNNFIDNKIQNIKLNPLEQWKIYQLKIRIYTFNLCDLKKSKSYSDSMLFLVDAFQTLKNNNEISIETYVSRADIFYHLHHYEESFKYYHLTSETINESKDNCLYVQYLYRIAMAYYDQGKYLESAGIFHKCSEYQSQCYRFDFPNFFKRQEVFANTALAYLKGGKPDSSIYFCHLATNFIHANRNFYINQNRPWDDAIAVIYGTLATSFSEKQMLDSAIYYYEKSISLNKTTGYNFTDRSLNLMRLALIHLSKNNYTKVLPLIEEDDLLNPKIISSRISKSDMLELELVKSDVRWQYYNKAGDYKKSIYFLEKHHTDNTNQDNYKKTLLSNNLISGIEREKEKISITSLEDKIAYEKIKNILFILILLLLATISGIIIRNYYTQSKNKEREINKVLFDSAATENDLLTKIDENQQDFITMIRNTDDYFWALDLNLKFLSFNKAYYDHFIELYGVKIELGKEEPFKTRNPKVWEMVSAVYNDVLTTGKEVKLFTKGIPINGVIPDIEFRARPLYNQNKSIKGITCTSRDISEYIALSNKINENKTTLSDIAWTHSHKLRGPISTIKGLLHAIQKESLSEKEMENMLGFLAEKIEEMDKVTIEIVESSEKNI
ncbi:MAG: hypothetical protein WCO54_08545 [Bacteroidota bacterium]